MYDNGKTIEIECPSLYEDDIMSEEFMMQEEKKIRLKQLQQQQRQKIYNARINAQKEHIFREISHFHKQYQFADKEDIIKLKTFLQSLPTITSHRLDISQLLFNNEVKYVNDINTHFNVYICFLCGSSELFELFPCGDIQDIINDFDSWQAISPYLILVFENFEDFLFIDDEKKIMQSRQSPMKNIK